MMRIRGGRLLVPLMLLLIAFTGLRIRAASPTAPQQVSSAAQTNTSTPSTSLSPRQLVDTYCVTCHNERLKTGGLMLDKADLTHIPANAETWEKVIRKVRAGMMPPVGRPRPAKNQLEAFASQLEMALDVDAARTVSPGRVGAHRLNRTEYANAIRDLLHLDIDVTTMLPPDGQSYGFDNMAAALVASPALLEKYVSAAARISRLAVGDRETSPRPFVLAPRKDLSQDSHVEGLPLGTRGGLVETVNFPLDGEYVIKPLVWRENNEIPRGMEITTEWEILIDDEVVHTAVIGGKEDDKVVYETRAAAHVVNEIEARLETRQAIKAGPHRVGVTFVSRSQAARLDLIQPYFKENVDAQKPTGEQDLKNVTITGPFKPTGVGDTPWRRAVFICHPANAADEAACAKRIAAHLAKLAFRQPPTTAQLDRVLDFYADARRDGQDFEAGIRAALGYVLASPEFLVRFEFDPSNVAPGEPYRLSDLALASRLSFFLWSSIPDEELIDIAAQGRLSQPRVLAQQVKRMLADDKAWAFTKNFTGQWLFLRNIDAFVPSPLEFPDFDGNLALALRRETEYFFKSIVDEDRPALDLLTADYTFLNERLGYHYDIPNVAGEQFRKVKLPDERRRGLLGQGSILTITSIGDRTSPVVRGKFVLSNMLGTPPPPPPPNVPALPNEPMGTALSMRQRMEAHRANPVCATCHRVMDPIGLSMEHFDGIGRWRDDDRGATIDASGQLADGTPINGAADLRAALVGRSDLFLSNLTQNLLTYAIGRGITWRDMPMVRSIVREATKNDYKFQSLIMAVIASPPFSMSTRDISTSGTARLATQADAIKN